jgi:hypothetical protein
MFRIVLLVAALAIMMMFKPAYVYAGYFRTGNQLFDNCSSKTSATAAFCRGYIIRVTDSIASGDVTKYRTCIPKNATVEQISDIAINWLRKYPEKRHHAAFDLVATAVKEAFPCP